MANEIERLVRKKIMLERIVSVAKDDSDRSSSGQAILVHIGESIVWQNLMQIDRQLWQLRVRVLGNDGTNWRYAVGRSTHEFEISEQEIMAGIRQYAEHLECSTCKMSLN